MEELNNIWNADDELNEDQLIKYINGKATAADAHVVEQKMADSVFVNDAVEGLQQFSSAEKISELTQQVNQDLHRKLITKRAKHLTGIQYQSWQIIAVIVIIVLCLLAYAIVVMLHK